MRIAKAAVVMLLSLPLIVHAQPPPPPPPQGLPALSDVQRAYASHDAAPLITRLADAVVVVRNGVQIAAGRSAAAALLQAWVRGSAAQIRSFSIGFDGLLTQESVNTGSMAPRGVIRDCCLWARSILYSIDRDGKITRLDVLETDYYDWQAAH